MDTPQYWYDADNEHAYTNDCRESCDDTHNTQIPLWPNSPTNENRYVHTYDLPYL